MASLSNSDRALLITILISAIILLMVFNLHLKRKSDLIAETYFEILSDEDIEPEMEDLEDVMKSLDEVMQTNRAINETESQDFEDEEFREMMEKIQNRDSRELDAGEMANGEYDRDYDQPDLSSFESVNEIIAKRSNNEESPLSETNRQLKNSSVSYSLVNRTDVYLPPPIYLCEQGGKIVVSIQVDWEGNVTSAEYNNASTSQNGCLIDHALEYAKASKFSRDPTREKQLGTITFLFKGKY